MTDERWQERAACRHVDPDLMFPGQGESVRQAKAVCEPCPVIAECLAYALDNGEHAGIWGGTSERDRQKLRRTMTIPRRGAAIHGTRARYAGGCRCEPCGTANNAYQVARRESA